MTGVVLLVSDYSQSDHSSAALFAPASSNLTAMGESNRGNQHTLVVLF